MGRKVKSIVNLLFQSTVWAELPNGYFPKFFAQTVSFHNPNLVKKTSGIVTSYFKFAVSKLNLISFKFAVNRINMLQLSNYWNALILLYVRGCVPSCSGCG